MNKLLVEVYIPTIGKAYDVLIPSKAKVYELTPLISAAIKRLSDGLFIADDATLCDELKGTIYRNNMSVEEMGLRNGSRIMLI